MTCRTMEIPGGGVAFVCTRGERPKSCVNCGGRAGYLCDWKLTGPKAGKTCDRALCARCAVVPRVDGEPQIDKHLCPAHGELWRRSARGSR